MLSFKKMIPIYAMLVILAVMLLAQTISELRQAQGGFINTNRAVVGLSDSCSCAIEFTGTSNEVIGGSHSNTCINVHPSIDLPPPNSAVDVAGSNLTPPPTPSFVSPIPQYYSLLQFDEVTDVFVDAAGSNYRNYTGNTTLPNATTTDTQMRNLLIYVDGNVTINGTALAYPLYKLTIVATGEISLTNVANKTFSSYLDQVMGDPQYSLLFFSGKDVRVSAEACNVGVQSSRGIYISTLNVDFNGQFYAPTSNIVLAGDSNFSVGNLTGWRVISSMSSSFIEHNPGGFPIATLTPTFTPSDIPTATSTACSNPIIAPSPLSPDHRAHLNDRTPKFRWSNVGGAQSYRLMVYSEDRSFEYKKRVFENTYTLKASEALSPARYLWRVRTQEATCSTWSAWSKRFTLFVD